MKRRGKERCRERKLEDWMCDGMVLVVDKFKIRFLQDEEKVCFDLISNIHFQ